MITSLTIIGYSFERNHVVFIIIKIFFLFTFLKSSKEFDCLEFKQSNNACSYCSYDYHLLDYNNIHFDKNLCILKNSSNYNREIIRSVLILNVPDKNYSSLFDTTYFAIFDSFYNETFILSYFYLSQIDIYLSKGSHFFIPTNIYQNIFFRRILGKITIQPLYCKNFNITDICLKDFEVVNLILKQKFIFYISSALYIIGINIIGSDLILASIEINTYNNATISTCLNNLSICCLDSYFDNQFNSESSDIQYLCGLKTRNISQNLFSFIGFITLEVIYDLNSTSDIILPSVFIENVILQDFLLIDNELQIFIFITIYGKVLIQNLTIHNFFAPKNFILYQLDNQILNFYENTIWYSNLLNKTLDDLLREESIIAIANVIFNYSFSLNFCFNSTNEEDITFFLLNDWKSMTKFYNISIINLINRLNGNLVIFSKSNDLIPLLIDDIITKDSEKIQLIFILNAVVYLSNSF